MAMLDWQIEQLTTDCAEKATELDCLKEELENCENQRQDLSEQLGILTADKNVADTDLKVSRTEAAQRKKELEVFITFSRISICTFCFLVAEHVLNFACIKI